MNDSVRVQTLGGGIVEVDARPGHPVGLIVVDEGGQHIAVDLSREDAARLLRAVVEGER